ncbi:Peptidase M16 inactive domain family protein [Clavispora lusitaniae]|uniref:Metalloendopeptidase n=1 Tax=Clavispora lusitaniae TaxID=36911 RepID=A0AA91PWS6_CLALS|nr:Peptidase M16 inactive domain family protein [Clavispora lusitaniae]OVF06612.1 putative metalloendopeptidase [Clavispora lusitaniae]
MRFEKCNTPSVMSNFVRQASFDVEYAPAHISKWVSKRTGLQITYVNQPSPVVNGYFAVATEIPDDSGCPHTLEHLVFMGSQKYPYKGLLDNLGNRFFSSTNAWTSVDQTVYTLTTAGWEGFKTLLTIYLDHLFKPTLTNEACLTEVYHIDGKGKEKGVVFSEMQGIENQSWFLTYNELQKTLYAETSGYSSETGGLTSELRHLTNDQIRDFHKAMYRPDNLCVVITGSVDEQELLEIMNEFDNSLSPLSDEPRKRPFVDSPHDMPLNEYIIKRVEFPDKDESMGELVLGWIGPESEKALDNLAVDMVGSYFTDSPISLFNKHLVEIEDPMATEIDYGTDDFIRTGLNFTVSGVPTDRLKEVDAKIKEMIEQSTKEESFDLQYMQQIVRQQMLKFVANTERSSTTFSNVAISEFIYGKKDGTDLEKWTKDLHEFEVLSTWSAKEWCDIIKKYFVDNKCASILGVPSSALNKSTKKENKQRIKDIREKYGEEGLAKLDQELKKAQEKNDLPIPDEVLTQFGKPDPSKIEFIYTKSYRAGANKTDASIYTDDDEFATLIKKDEPEDMPLFLHFEEFKSRFVTVHIIMPTTNVPESLLCYFSLIEEIFSLSIKKPDAYIPYEKVISDINNDLIEFQFDNGLENQFVELASVKIKFEANKYERAIQWLIDVLKYSVFEESRLRVMVEKIINSLPDKKRSSELMMYSSQHRTIYNTASLRKSQDSIYTEKFYRSLLEKLDNGKFSEIEADLETFKSKLFNVANMNAFVVGGCKDLEKPVSSWAKFAQEFSDTKEKFDQFTLEKLPRAFQFKTEEGQKCSGNAHLVTTSASETTHLVSLTTIPTDYLDEDIFKIALASEFLGGVEGPFWRGIRGTGLAYGANIRSLVEAGYLSFTIYRGADAQQAWLTGKKIISDYTSGVLKIDHISIENSIAAIVNELANAESNAYDASINKMVDNLFKKRGASYLKHFLARLNSYTAEDLVYIMKKYFLPLFEPSTSLLFCCLPTGTVDEFSEFMGKVGYNVSVEEIASTQVDGHSEDSHSCGSGCGSDCDSHEEEWETGSEEETDSEEDTDESESEEETDSEEDK